MARTATVQAWLCIVLLSGVVAAVACMDAEPERTASSASQQRAPRARTATQRGQAGSSLSTDAAEEGKPRSDCYACHERDYRHARRHVDLKPTRCAVCHRETGWHPTQKNHPWPLAGRHAKADCFDCHVGSPPVFEGTDDACVSCHREDYDDADYPGHDKFALTCEDCHSTQGWKPAKEPKRMHAEPEPGETQPTAAETESAPQVDPSTAAEHEPTAAAESPIAAQEEPEPAAQPATGEPSRQAPVSAKSTKGQSAAAPTAATPATRRPAKSAQPTTTSKTAAASRVAAPSKPAASKTATASKATAASKTPTASKSTSTSSNVSSTRAKTKTQSTSKTTAASKTTSTPKPKHPERAFPISQGNHVDIDCETCHSQAGNTGKANTDCVQCHKRSKYDRKHRRITEYPTGVAPLNFCVDCHTKGTVKPVARSR